MTKITVVIIGLLASSIASAQIDDSRMNKITAERRAYPGGRDDSDLTVQNLRQIVKRELDLESYDTNHDPVGPEYDASGADLGFGE